MDTEPLERVGEQGNLTGISKPGMALTTSHSDLKLAQWLRKVKKPAGISIRGKEEGGKPEGGDLPGVLQGERSPLTPEQKETEDEIHGVRTEGHGEEEQAAVPQGDLQGNDEKRGDGGTPELSSGEHIQGPEGLRGEADEAGLHEAAGGRHGVGSAETGVDTDAAGRGRGGDGTEPRHPSYDVGRETRKTEKVKRNYRLIDKEEIIEDGL